MSSVFKLDIGCVERDEDRSDLLSACGQLDLRAIRHLVDVKGVDVREAVDTVGQNCIHYVVGSSLAAVTAPAAVAAEAAARQEQLLGYLASAGADVNAQRASDGWTPMFLAAIFGQERLASALLGAGAKVAVKDHEGWTPEDWAGRYRMEQVKNLLVHSRSKVAHSRFSCVRRGPALEQPPSLSSPTPSSTDESSTDNTPTSPPSSSSASTEKSPIAAAASAMMGESKDTAKACLLTAQ